jgi:hypothetical protein
MTQRVHNQTIEDLLDSEGDEFLFAEVRRKMIRIFDELEVELKRDIQKQLNEFQENTDKK